MALPLLYIDDDVGAAGSSGGGRFRVGEEAIAFLEGLEAQQLAVVVRRRVLPPCAPRTAPRRATLQTRPTGVARQPAPCSMPSAAARQLRLKLTSSRA